MNNALKGLQPEKVFMFFEELTQIPHGSHNTKQISDFCVDFAKKEVLKYIRMNIIMWLFIDRQARAMRMLPV